MYFNVLKLIFMFFLILTVFGDFCLFRYIFIDAQRRGVGWRQSYFYPTVWRAWHGGISSSLRGWGVGGGRAGTLPCGAVMRKTTAFCLLWRLPSHRPASPWAPRDPSDGGVLGGAPPTRGGCADPPLGVPALWLGAFWGHSKFLDWGKDFTFYCSTENKLQSAQGSPAGIISKCFCSLGHRVLALLSRLRESELSCPTLAFSRVEGGVGAATRTPAVLHPRTGPCCPIPHGQRQADFLCSYRVSCSHCLLELPVCSELYKLYPSPQPLCKGIVNPHFAAEEAVVQRGEASCPGRVTEQASAEPGIRSQAWSQFWKSIRNMVSN